MLNYYASGLFVSRQNEIERIMVSVKELASSSGGDSVTVPRVFYATGNTQTGKSWFLQHCQNQIGVQFDSGQVACHLLVLNPTSGPSAVPRNILIDLVRSVSGYSRINLDRMDDAALSGLITDYLDGVFGCKPQCAVLLVDDVDLADNSLLRYLEARLFAPWILHTGSVIVFAGRSSAYIWYTFPLRSRDEFDLKQFSLEDTHKQLLLQYPQWAPRANDIYMLSRGVPGFNKMIVGGLVGQVPRTMEFTREVQANLLDQLIQQTLSNPLGVISNWDLRVILEALSVLDGFDNDHHETIPVIDIVAPRAKNRVPGNEAAWREFFKALQPVNMGSGSLLRWNRGDCLYHIDTPVRCLLEDYLKVQRPTEWNILHQTARNLYMDWDGKASGNMKAFWSERSNFHQKQINQGPILLSC